MPTLKLAIDATKAKAGAQEFNSAAGSVTNATNSTGGALKKLFLIMGGFALLRKTIGVWREYELTMATLKGVAGATEEQFKKLNDTARQLGASTQFSAKEAGEGLLFLARAGFTADQAIKAIPSTLNLAITGLLDLGTAADIASNVLSQFGLKASETERIVDTLTTTANSSNTTVAQLAEALKFAGPVAGALGLSVEETSAALGVLGNSGIQASLAGTNLRGVLSALLSTTDEAKESLRKMGLSMDDINPEKNNLIEIFKKFGSANLTASDAVEIFGRRNAAAALIMSKNIGTIEELTTANEKAKGATAELAGEMQDTLNGSLKGLNSAFEEMLLSAGDSGLLGTFRTMVDVVADVIRLFSGAEAKMLDMQLLSIELARQFDIAWATINNGLSAFVDFVDAEINDIKATWAVLTGGLSDLWIDFTTGLGSALRSSIAVVEGILNFTVNTFKRGINEIVKTIINSGAATAILEKLGVTAQDLADTYTATMTTNRSLSEEISKTSKIAADEQAKVNKIAAEGKAANQQAIIAAGAEAEAITLRSEAREKEFEKQIEGINAVAQASAFKAGEDRAIKESTGSTNEDEEAVSGPTADELKAAQDEIDAVLTDTQSHRLEILSSGLSLEDQMRTEAFDKKKEQEMERSKEDLEFIQGLHSSAFESEEEKARILEDINAKHLDRMNLMEDEFHNERMKRDAKKHRMRLEGASQFLEAAAILSEAFGNGSLANSKAFGVAQAAVSTAIGISRAMELGFPAAYPAMALAAATGAAQIATILGASKGSGAINSPSVGGGASSLTAGATDNTSTQGEGQRQPTEVDFRISGLAPGQLVSTEMVESIFNRMDEMIDDDFRPRNIVVSN